MTDFNPLFDCIIGVFYGTEDELNASYRTIARDYPVFIGQNFWHRLTGDKNFYFDLINAFAEVAVEMDSTELINNVLQELTQQIRDAEL